MEEKVDMVNMRSVKSNPILDGSKLISVDTKIGTIFFEVPRVGYVRIINKELPYAKILEYFFPIIQSWENREYCRCSICKGELQPEPAIFGFLTKTQFACCWCVDILQNELPFRYCDGNKISEQFFPKNLFIMIVIFFSLYLVSFIFGLFLQLFIYISIFLISLLLGYSYYYVSVDKEIHIIKQIEICCKCKSNWDENKCNKILLNLLRSIYMLVRKGFFTKNRYFLSFYTLSCKVRIEGLSDKIKKSYQESDVYNILKCLALQILIFLNMIEVLNERMIEV
jgi:hypothetical protein